jgi:hypothetical protein
MTGDDAANNAGGPKDERSDQRQDGKHVGSPRGRRRPLIWCRWRGTESTFFGRRWWHSGHRVLGPARLTKSVARF